MVKKYIVIALFMVSFFAQAQDTIVQKEPDNKTYLNYITNYFMQYPPKDNADSLFFNSFYYLLSFELDDSLRATLEVIDELIYSNRLHFEVQNLYPFRDFVDSLNTERHSFLADYWEHRRLLAMADTSSIATTDTVFFKVLEGLMYQDTINYDSVMMDYEPYNDSILLAINESIDIFKKNKFVEWVKRMRRDTTNFYIVDIEGDSMLLRLYNNSPQMMRVNITDYWGKSVKAVVRDIHSNSFRLLIDDAPLVDNETEEKAKKAMGSLGTLKKNLKKLTIEPRPYNPPVKRWIVGGNANVDMSQVALHQWAQGGESTISILSGLNLFAKYKGEAFTWDNTAEFKYGVIRQGEYISRDTSSSKVEFRPNEDKINITSKYGRKVFGNFSTSILGNFKSQFAEAYEWDGNVKTENQLSEFMSPGIVTFALGMDYKYKKELKMFLSPLSSKSTYVLLNDADIRTKYKLDTTKNVRHEMGAILNVSHKIKIWDDIEMENKLELFSNYIENPQNIDLDWEFKFIFPVNEFIKATLSSHIIYDDDVMVTKKNDLDDAGNPKKAPGFQIREGLTIGFAVKF